MERRRLIVQFVLSGAVLAPGPNRTFCPIYTPFHSLSLQLPTCPSRFTMSQPPSISISTPSSNFQTIFYAALKAYEKKTKKDLLAHPLAAQVQACKSPDDIRAVLQDKVNELDQSMSAHERLSRWLNPTINVLYSFSATIGPGLVSAIKSTCPLITNFAGILPRIRYLLRFWGTPLGERRLWSLCGGDSHYDVYLRRPKMSKRAKTHSSISLGVSKTSSGALILIPQYDRQTR